MESTITSTLTSNSNVEQAFFHFQGAFQTLNELRNNLFEFTNPNSNILFTSSYVSNIIHDIGDFYPSLDNTLLLSTLHGSLYETSDDDLISTITILSTTHETILQDTIMEDTTIQENENNIPVGSSLPNRHNNLFENSSNIIDLTNISDSDEETLDESKSKNKNNVISIVDDRNETKAVRNLIITHMNDTMESIPDERNSIRTIRKKIRETVNKHSEELLSFMVKPVDEIPIVSKLKRVSNRLCSPNFNPSASWISNELNSFVDDDRICETIEHDVGTSFTNLTNHIKNLHISYQSTVQNMLQLSEVIDKKLDMIEIILSSLKTLPNISETNPASVALYTSIYDYVKHEMESCNIEKDYKEFIHSYGLFQKYRHLLQLAQSSYVGVSESQKPPGASCNICMTDNISFAMIPCGHTFCTNCTNRTRNICFICRASVHQKMKIYIH
jgi:hypothetical protein